MSIVINTNVPSLMAAHHVRTTRDGLETAMERLASGKRINTAADDAAGAGVASRLNAHARGAEMAMRNVGDTLSVLRIADNALIETENMLQRIYELEVQQLSTNIYSTGDITNIEKEVTELTAELADIVSNTKYNGTAVFGATFTTADDAFGGSTGFVIPAGLSAPSAATVAGAEADLTTIAGQRADIGSFINRLEYKLNNLSVFAANTLASVSRIEDTDYAAESAAVAKGQVLQQAGAAMLAQANASSQYVLTLLQ